MGAFPEHVFSRTLTGSDTKVPGAVSAASANSITSDPTAPGRERGITYEITTDADGSGTLVGTLSMQYRHATPKEIARGEDVWRTFTASSTSNTITAAISESGGSATTQLVQLRNVGPYQIRLKFDRSSGDGVVYAKALAY